MICIPTMITKVFQVAQTLIQPEFGRSHSNEMGFEKREISPITRERKGGVLMKKLKRTRRLSGLVRLVAGAGAGWGLKWCHQGGKRERDGLAGEIDGQEKFAEEKPRWRSMAGFTSSQCPLLAHYPTSRTNPTYKRFYVAIYHGVLIWISMRDFNSYFP